jgi:aspartate/methionine/tyrosine aminotransferase
MFSSRTNWHRQPNRLAELLEECRKSGKPIYDLTNSNPTDCGIHYPEQEILSALSNPDALQYHPDPRGLLTAREAISNYYREKNVRVNLSDIFLTASTSEAYSLAFKLLCNPGESILVPRPSYPLFDYLAQVNDVLVQHYYLIYDHGWHIDIESLKNARTESTRAIVMVNPHNPTGMFLKKSEYNAIEEFGVKNNLAFIVDEVFADYAFVEDKNRIASTAGNSEVLTFTLNGISKLAGFPQMKLGWIVVGGEESIRREASERLEILCDTFLSVNTPVQVALPELFRIGQLARATILDRIKSNYKYLYQAFINTACTLAPIEGSWYAILKVPRTKSDEEWALGLLEHKGVYLYPGYFFDFVEEGYLVVSLLADEVLFRQAITEVMNYLSAV